MYYIGKFYGFLLFEKLDGTICISQGSSIFKDEYKNINEAKEQIRQWMRKTRWIESFKDKIWGD